MIGGASNRQSGMTLIEVLAALVILAIGLIGVTSLQLNALRNVKVSGDVQAVTSGVNELVELMRLNGDNAPDYDGLTTSSCSNKSISAGPAAAESGSRPLRGLRTRGRTARR